MTRRAARYVAALILIAAGGIVMFSIFGCRAKAYKIDFNGQESCYPDAKSSYREGETVTLSFPFVATDTVYSFYLDGAPIPAKNNGADGFVISFMMPGHDVSLKCTSKNTMEYVPDIPSGTMLADYYRATVATVGGDGHLEMVLSTTDDGGRYRLDVYSKEYGEDEVCTSYLVPEEAKRRCFELIDRAGFRGWDSMSGKSGITGAVYVCKFRDDDGSYVRVSTEDMPDDGRELIQSVGDLLSEYAKDEYLIKGE